jgi:hypothetical protein
MGLPATINEMEMSRNRRKLRNVRKRRAIAIRGRAPLVVTAPGPSKKALKKKARRQNLVKREVRVIVVFDSDKVCFRATRNDFYTPNHLTIHISPTFAG